MLRDRFRLIMEIIVALLEAVGILPAGRYLLEALDRLLDRLRTSMRREGLLHAAEEDFIREAKKQGLEQVAQWVTSFPIQNLPAFRQALERLREGDEKTLVERLAQEFDRIPAIQQEQKAYAIALYLDVLYTRLLADKDFNPVVLGLRNHRIEERVKRFIGLTEDLVAWSFLTRYLEELENKVEFFVWQPGKTKRDVAVPVFVIRALDGERIRWDRFLREHRRILITGAPGIGKTFAIEMAILKLIDQARASIQEGRIEKAPIPVYLTSDDLREDSAEEVVRKRLGLVSIPRFPSSLRDNLWIFVDGVIEFSEKTRRFIMDLDRFLGKGGHLVLVTAIPPDLPILPEATICEIAPLTKYAQRNLISRLTGMEKLAEILRRLRRSPYLQELCSRPLFLTIYCLTGELKQTEGLHIVLCRSMERAGINRGDLEFYLMRWSQVAFRLFKGNTGRTEFSFEDFCRELGIVMALPTAAHEVEKEFRVLKNSGIVKTSEATVSFAHPSLAFYLVGRGWAQEFIRNQETIWQRLEDRRWDPVWPFLAGHLAAIGRESDMKWLAEEVAKYVMDWTHFKTREDMEAALGILLQCLWEGKVSPIPEQCMYAIVQAIDTIQQHSWDDQWKRIHCWPWWDIALEMSSTLERPIRAWVRNWVYQLVKGALMLERRKILKLIKSIEKLPNPLVRWSILWITAAWKDLVEEFPRIYIKWRERLLDSQEHPAVRALAARALAYHRYKYADMNFIMILNDSRTPAPVKVAALKCLGRLARDNPDGREGRLKIIYANLASEDPLVLQGAIHALENTCHHCTEDQKISFLKMAPDWLAHSYPPVRSGAASLIGAILKRPEYRSGRWWRACCRLKPAELQCLVETLVRALSDPMVTVRRSAAWALGQMARWCLCGQELRQYRETLLQRFKEEADAKVVGGIAGIFVGLKDSEATSFFLEFLRDPFKVRSCFWALMQLEKDNQYIENRFSQVLRNLPPETVRALYEPVYSQEDPDWAVEISLRMMKARSGAELIRPLLKAWKLALEQKSSQRYRPELWEQFSRVLMEAADAPALKAWVVPVLAQIYAGPEELRVNVEAWIQERIRSWLEDREPRVRKAAWQALLSALERGVTVIPQNELREILRRILDDSQDKILEFRKEILLVAEKVGLLPPNLERFLEDHDGSIRAAATGLLIKGVRKQKIQPPVEVAKKLIHDPDPKVRASAAGLVEVLLPKVQRHDREAFLEALISLLSDRSREVQSSAIIALHRNVHLLSRWLGVVATEVEKKLYSSDPKLQGVALEFLEDLASQGYKSSLVSVEEALELLKRGTNRLMALWCLGSQTEWMNKDKIFWQVYKQIKRLVQDTAPGGPVQPTELASALLVLNIMLKERRDLARALQDPEWWGQKAFKLLNHPDPRLVRGAMGLLGTIARYHKQALEEGVVQQVLEYAWKWLTSKDRKDQATALYVFQTDAFLQLVIKTYKDFLEHIKNIVLTAHPEDKILATALCVLRRPIAWESLTEQQKAEIFGKCLDLLNNPQGQHVEIVLDTLASARIAKSLPAEGLRKVVERVLVWLEAPNIPTGVLCGVLALLREPPYWQFMTESLPERLLVQLLSCSDESLQATTLAMFLKDHVWSSLSPQFQTQALEWAKQLSCSKSPAVRRNALWVCVRYLGEGQEDVRRLLKSPNTKDLIVAIQAAVDLAGRWGEETLYDVMKRLWELMGSSVPAVATLAWPAYARLLDSIGAPYFYLKPFINRACEAMTRETKYELLYGVFEGLIELAHRLGERDRKRVGETLKNWLQNPREKVRMKAAFLMALIGEPMEAVEALRKLGVSQEELPKEIPERRQFLQQILEAKEEEL